MAAQRRCPHCLHSSNMALSSGRLVTSIISHRAGKGAEFCLSAVRGSLSCTATYYTRSIRCEISYAAWRFIVCAYEFSLAERNFEENSPFVLANYRLIRREISCELSSELSSKSHGNKERISRISLALLLHNTVLLCHAIAFPRTSPFYQRFI